MNAAAASADTATEDRLLGGRVRLMQPRHGYRAATDPVLLAAAMPSRSGERVLDLGCGAGAAALCLAARVPDVALSGLELQPEYAAFARQNAVLNEASFDVLEGDVADPPAALRAQTFDGVMMNPPYHPASVQAGPIPGRDKAHRERVPLGVWIDTGLQRLKPQGWIAVIQRIERLPEILTALAGRAGEIAVLPLAARDGRAAKRAIVRARKAVRGPFRLAAPLVLHAGPAHLSDSDDFTPHAQAILRDAAPLDF